MDHTLPEISLPHRKRLIEELTQGRELVKELKIILDKPSTVDEYSVANDLLIKISSTFVDSISLIPESSPTESQYAYGQKEDSGNSSNTSDFKNRQGCDKRRKKLHTSTQLISSVIDDGHAWRKYGQKAIKNSKQPRNYYRCTHKFDQGCQATKQVQKNENEPPMYHVTYHGDHTCKTPQNPQIIFDTLNFNDSKYFINFDQSRDDPTLLNFPSGKQECNPSIGHNEYVPADRDMAHDLMTIGSSNSTNIFSSRYSDQGDGMSYFSATSAPYIGIDYENMKDDFNEFHKNLELEFAHCYT